MGGLYISWGGGEGGSGGGVGWGGVGLAEWWSRLSQNASPAFNVNYRLLSRIGQLLDTHKKTGNL